jgi:hypothetical protein
MFRVINIKRPSKEGVIKTYIKARPLKLPIPKILGPRHLRRRGPSLRQIKRAPIRNENNRQIENKVSKPTPMQNNKINFPSIDSCVN